MRFYVYSYLIALVICAALLIRDKDQYEVSTSQYREFLSVPWKLCSFLAATAGITLIAPYTGDPYWDYVDAIFMSVLAFYTAPWVVAVFYKSLRERFSITKLYVAICLWMFSASWSFDLYFLIKNGEYPLSWASNILASSVLYFCAGLFWSLDWGEERGVHFAFTEPGD